MEKTVVRVAAGGEMTRSRAIVTGFAAFFVSQVLTVIIHGFILVSDYEPFKGRCCAMQATTRSKRRACCSVGNSIETAIDQGRCESV